MKNIKFLLGLFFSTILLLNAGSALAAKQTTIGCVSPTLEFMFVQTSYKATLATTKQNNIYKLTLHDVSPYVTYFSDRPHRLAGAMGIESYLGNWKQYRNQLNKDAPNADLAGVYNLDAKRHMVNLVVELHAPIYDSSAKTLTYQVKVLSETPGVELLKNPMKHTVLFIDAAWCPSCDHGGFGS